VVHRRAVPFLPQDTATYESVGVVKVPDAQPRQIALTGLLLPTALLEPGQMPRSIFPDAKLPRLALTAFVSRPGTDDLGVDSGVPQWEYSVDTSKLQQLKTPDGEPYRVLLAPGATAQLPDGAGTVTFEGLRRYGVFDVRHDPGKELALIFAGLALAGVTASLFVRRRRLWVRASAGPDGRTVVEAAGLARGEDTGLAQEVAAVLAAVGRHEGSDDRGTVPAGQG
jgi:cytochrome c biogenesis protein